MAFHYFDVLTFSFTPRNFEVELLGTACEKNIITCLSQNTSKEFIALKLVQEFSYELRRTENKKSTIYLSNRKTAYNLLHYLTDLKVINLNELSDEEIDWENLLDDYQVILIEAKKCLDALLCYYITFEQVNLIIVDNCHCKDDQASILEIFTNYYANTVEKPKIFGLAGPIHNAQCPSARLGAELELLEYILKAKAETCSDIVTVLRYSPKPTEIIAECSPPKQNDVSNYLRNLILTRKAFIKDHRYDLSEIYGDYMDELKSVPDPTVEPLKYLDDFLNVLDELGAYCADKAALSLLIQIEKQKIKTPYERHFLLLCLVSTTFIQVRSFCETMFQQIKNEKERIDTYSSPKVKRILEVLRLFKPEKINLNLMNRKALKNQENSEIEQKCQAESCIEIINEIKSSNINSMLTTTSDNIQQISDNLESLKLSVNKLNNESLAIPPQMKTHYNKFRFKNRKRFFYQRPNHHRFHNQNESDALCGLIFCNSTFTTKTLFCLFCEVSRHDPDLKFLNVQYTIDRTADPIAEPKEYELEHRKQEEVLKKFRMHECNLLISTSVLEEGFDLPKCNLVVRWDPPESYRSYVQCKGRARAPNALHIIMVSPKVNRKIYDSSVEEELTDTNHKFICDHIRQNKNYPESLEKSFELGTGSELSGTSEYSDTVSYDDDDSDDSEDENYSRKCVVEEVGDKAGCAAVEEAEDFYENVENCTSQIIDKLAEYMEIEKVR
jgi:endoribonuclease Dicer